MEELSRTIEELKEKRAKIRRAREMLEERRERGGGKRTVVVSGRLGGAARKGDERD